MMPSIPWHLCNAAPEPERHRRFCDAPFVARLVASLNFLRFPVHRSTDAFNALAIVQCRARASTDSTATPFEPHKHRLLSPFFLRMDCCPFSILVLAVSAQRKTPFQQQAPIHISEMFRGVTFPYNKILQCHSVFREGPPFASVLHHGEANCESCPMPHAYG